MNHNKSNKDEINPQAYMEMVMDQFRHRGIPGMQVMGPGGMMIRLASGFLHDCSTSYYEYLHCDAKERTENIRKLVSMLSCDMNLLSRDLDEVGNRLMPRVRNRAARCRERIQRLTDDSLSLPPAPWDMLLGHHLEVDVVLDMPDGMVWFDPPGDLQAKQRAIDNALRNLRDRGPAKFRKVQPGVYIHEDQDCYAGSQMLLEQQFALLRLKGRPVVTTPTTYSLLVAGSEDQAGINALFNHTLRLNDDTLPVSPLPLDLVDGTWRAYLPPRDFPSREAFQMLNIDVCGKEHDLNMVALRHQFPRRLAGMQAASLWPAATQARIVTYCEISVEQGAILPETDYVKILGGGKAAEMTLPWSDFANVVGAGLQLLNIWPRAYLMALALTAEQINDLRKISQKETPDLRPFTIALGYSA